MKKKIIVLFSLMLVSLQCFAAEFIISPAIGYSNIAGSTNWSAEVGATKAKGDLDFSLKCRSLASFQYLLLRLFIFRAIPICILIFIFI